MHILDRPLRQAGIDLGRVKGLDYIRPELGELVAAQFWSDVMADQVEIAVNGFGAQRIGGRGHILFQESAELDLLCLNIDAFANGFLLFLQPVSNHFLRLAVFDFLFPGRQVHLPDPQSILPPVN